MRKTQKRRGMTMVETCIALLLMSFIMLLAVNLAGLMARGFWSTEMEITVTTQDAAFAAQVNQTIQESTTLFTVPEKSFVKEKFTAGWHYLGVMEDVHIPAVVSRTGEEIASAKALVYIAYVGNEKPASVPSDCNLIQNSNGYFYQQIIGHAFTDPDGRNHDYSLTFHPKDPVNLAAQAITYKFDSNITDKKGNLVGNEKIIDIDTMLNALNSIQVVYKGSKTNPAVALAFRPDFLPTYSVDMMKTEKPAATIAMVLDLSGSMTAKFGETTRVAALIKNATKFAEDLSSNERVNIILIPFSNHAAYKKNYAGWKVPNTFVYNAAEDKVALRNAIESLSPQGVTNVGDGVRLAYFELERLKSSGKTMGSEFIVLMTDGEMNTLSMNDKRYGWNDSNLYLGSSPNPSDYDYYYREQGKVNRNEINRRRVMTQDYMKHWAGKIVKEHKTTNYLISLAGGMSASDKKALESVFGTQAFDVDSLTTFESTFEEINNNINDVMWAFEGPQL